jgi:lysozyme
MEQPDADTVLGEAAALAVPFEGWSAAPYRDPAGVWTIGYGSTRDRQGDPVTADTPPVTVAEGTALMRRDMTAALNEVFRDVTVPLTADQAAAIADLVYNIGTGSFAESTLLRLLDRGDLAGAAAQFDAWDHAGGVVLAGLLRRREAERALFLKA